MDEKKVETAAKRLIDVTSPLNLFPNSDAKEFVKTIVELIADEVVERLQTKDALNDAVYNSLNVWMEVGRKAANITSFSEAVEWLKKNS